MNFNGSFLDFYNYSMMVSSVINGKNSTTFNLEKLKEVFYAKKSRAYYANEMYMLGFGKRDIFKYTIEDYNPIPKTVSVMVALSVQKGIYPISKKRDEIERIWNHNKLENILYDKITEALLTKNLVVELFSKKDPISKEIKTEWVFHPIDNCEIKYDGTGKKIIYAKIEGYTEELKADTELFEKVKYTREYFNTDELAIEKLTDERGNSVTYPLVWNFIPMVHKKFDYSLDTAFNKIDRINEYEAQFGKVSEFNSDPIVTGSKTKSFTKGTTDKLKDRFNGRKILHLGEGELKYLELKGSHLNALISKQDKIKLDYENEYPEFVLAKVLSGSNVSTETASIKMTEVTAKVDSCRSDLNQFLSDLSIKSAAMEGIFIESDDYKTYFYDIVPTADTIIVNNLVALLTNNLITPETAVKVIPEKYVSDPIEEYKKLVPLIEEAKKQLENENKTENKVETEEN
jgi:hypothetical protein